MELRRLENGLRVVLVPCEAESVAAGLFIATGSRHETAREAGVSHFVEHMLFKGTPTRTPLQISQALEGRGGNFNACTSEEATCYYTHMPDEYLGESVDILSDMYLNASFPKDEFEREKGVIIEEIRMYDDDPDSVAMENLQRNLFPRCSLGAPVAGTPESLLPMRPEDLRRYVAGRYLPSNTIAVVVGSFDPDRAMRELSSRLGGFSRKGRRAPDGGSPLRGRVVPFQTASRDIKQTQVALGYRTFGIHDGRRYAATVFDAVMGRGMSSRLFQSVRERRGLSYDIASHMRFFGDAGMWTVGAGVAPEKAEAAMAVIDRECARIREHRVSAAELKRTKEFLIGNFKMSHEAVVAKLFFYGQTLLAFGRVVSPEDQIDGIRAVTAEDVQAVAGAIVRPGCRSASLVTPK